MYLKFSSVSSCVISLKRSSLKAENTFKSLTKISTAFARSRLHYYYYYFCNQVSKVATNFERHFQIVTEQNSKVDINELEETYLSKASRYFCFLISKKIFIEYLLSSTFVNPDKYFSTSSHSPFVTISSKYLMLKKKPESCSNLNKIITII